MTNKNFSTQFNIDQELTPSDEDSQRILEIALQTPAVDETFKRSPLNLALVLDRSGSMSGAKLDYVKQAAAHVVGLLNDTDRIALVDFDDKVRVLFPSAQLAPKSRKALKKAISSIHSGGTTNLFGGWITGCEQVASAGKGGTINRTLLLTDGLANVGISDPPTLAYHSRELATRGVFTSTFGVGTGFHHHLLESMANQGEGRFYFIEGPASIANIFESEFQELLTIFAHEVEVTLSYPPEIEVRVLGEWQHESPEPGKLRLNLGSIPADRSREVFIKLSIPAGSENTELPFKINVMAKGEKGELLEAVSERSIRMTSRGEAESAPKNTGLLERFAEVELADRAAEALKLEMEGKYNEASRLLNHALNIHSPAISPDLNQYYTGLSERMQHGMDELDRKRSHHDSYIRKQRRQED